MFDIITIGTATRDIFLTSPDFKALKEKDNLSKISFALGDKIEVNEPIFAYGGGALNAAVAFRRQGFKTAALVKIGNDEAAEKILKELKKEKINSLAIRERGEATAFSTILLMPNGERAVLIYRGASEDLKIHEIPLRKLEARWAYITPGRISFETIEKLFEHFYKNKTLIAFNPSKYYLEMGLRKLRPLLEKTSVAILNREEASYLTGVHYQKEKEIFRKLDEAIDGIAVMTEGSRGVMVSDGKNIYSAGVFKVKMIDQLGAGDAFGSGFVSGLIRKNINSDTIERAIALGSANAASVVEKIGAQRGILTKSDFEKQEKWNKLEIKTHAII